MAITYTASMVSSLFGSSSSSGVGTDLLTSYFASKYGTSTAAAASTTSSGTSSTSASGTTKTTSPTGNSQAPDAPWYGNTSMASESQLVQNVMNGQNFINSNAVSSDVIGSSPDYTKLFTLYQGLNALEGIATAAQATNLSANQLKQYQSRFNEGMSEVDSYINSTKYDHVSLTEGTLTKDLKNTVGTAQNVSNYVGQDISTGAASDPVAAFQGDVQFSMSVQRIGTKTPITVNFNLADMGTTTRSMSNVVTYMNQQLAAAGVQTRMAVNRTPGTAITSTVNGTTTTIGTNPDTFGLEIQGSPVETVTMSAPDTAQSVYVVQTSGNPTQAVSSSSSSTSSTSTSTGTTTPTTDVTAQILKFQTNVSTSGAAVAPTVGKPGDTYWTAGEAEQTTLPSTIVDTTSTTTGTTTTSALSGTIASAAAPDGSLYVLANVNATTDGQTISGNQDVALMKYDSAGNLVYTRTLGASDTASATSIAVSADGKVAIAGSVTGALNVATSTTAKDGTITTTDSGNLSGADPTTSDSFVQVFDANGVPQWTQRFGSSAADQATTVTFGANDSVIVGGKTQGTMTGATANGGTGEQGGWDAYVAGFSSTGKQTFMQQTGTPQTDQTSQVAVSGNTMYVASQQNNSVILSSYDMSSGTPTLTATRNLGGLGGGTLSGISVYNGQVYLGGSASANKLLNGTANTTSAYSGTGYDAFGLSVSSDLTNTSSDTIAYYGGSGGNEQNAQVQFANGVAYMAGQATTATTTNSAGTNTTGKGYLASLNVATGQVLSQTTYNGADGQVNPNSIAVSAGSSSVLDKLGLPTGTILQNDSTDITANSSVRAGDEFYMVDPNTGTKKTITIDAGETMATLATKIQRASNGELTVKTQSIAGLNGGPSVLGLDIEPSYGSSSMEFLSGPAGQDALAGLGLSPGLVTSQAGTIMDPTSVSYTSSQKPMGLNFNTGLNLNSSTNIATAIASLQKTIQSVQNVYNYLSNGDPQPVKAGANSSANSAPPTYLTNEISNYQAALNRLTGSS